MDVIVLALACVFGLILALLAFMGRGSNVGWAFFALFGAFIMVFSTIALWTDGSLTTGSQVLAAANGTYTSDFFAISLIPFMLCVSCFMVALRRAFNL